MASFSYPTVAVIAQQPSLHAQAASLAQDLGLPLAMQLDQRVKFYLHVTPERLELVQLTERIDSIWVDFLDKTSTYRRQHMGQHQELLAKAVKLKGFQSLKILDATAGLGQDAFVLASHGHQLQLLERSPIVAALLADGLNRLVAVEPEFTMHLIQQDANDYLAQLTVSEQPDIIYLDPMFPPRNKTAAVKKEMRILQALLGEQQDSEKLFQLALHKAKYRVVVKRPRLAPALSDICPNFVVAGKACRFDVYLPQAAVPKTL